MTEAEKLTSLKAILGFADTTYDTQLSAYLALAKAEVLGWLYSGLTPETVTAVPSQYEVTQIFAVVSGFNLQGAEGQTSHSENGISRQWKYEDMVAYIRNHVTSYAGVV